MNSFLSRLSARTLSSARDIQPLNTLLINAQTKSDKSNVGITPNVNLAGVDNRFIEPTSEQTWIKAADNSPVEPGLDADFTANKINERVHHSHTDLTLQQTHQKLETPNGFQTVENQATHSLRAISQFSNPDMSKTANAPRRGEVSPVSEDVTNSTENATLQARYKMTSISRPTTIVDNDNLLNKPAEPVQPNTRTVLAETQQHLLSTLKPRAGYIAQDIELLGHSRDQKPESTIKITIGRIDVRAATETNVKTRKAARKKPLPGLSLDSYLHQRSGG